MLKQLIAFLFILSFFMQTFSSAFIVFNYYTNTALFASKCVNKSKPELHCNGKCQMAAQLQKEENKNQQNPERKTENKTEIFYSSGSHFAELPLLSSCTIREMFAPFAQTLQTGISRSFFHPPDPAV